MVQREKIKRNIEENEFMYENMYWAATWHKIRGDAPYTTGLISQLAMKRNTYRGYSI